jgi:hypothetical protein
MRAQLPGDASGFSETRSAQILLPVPGTQHRMGDKAVAQQRRLGILLELLYFFHLARSSSRLGHGPFKAGARVRVP